MPQTIGLWIATVTDSWIAVMFIVAIFVLIVGCFVDVLPAVIILVPVLAPLTDQFGIDPLHFAMAIVLNLTIGLITPPVGGVLFIMTSVTGLRFERLSRAIVPLIAAEVVVLVLVILFPAVSTTFPGWFGYTR